jgi:ribosome biogenesis GTPase
VCKRKNVFTRKDKNRSREDLIASNLDYIVVVQSFSKPKLNFRFVDRLLVRSAYEDISSIICVNKSDLSEDCDIESMQRYYCGAGVRCMAVSAKTGSGLEKLYETIVGRLSLFIGTSGVGKSSMLNALFPELALKTSMVSESTGKGRHTTTNVEMVSMRDNTRIIDTPGLREFGLMDIHPDELADYFMEFRYYSPSCSFQPCTHNHEPDCEVKRRVDSNEIDYERYISYMNILQSLIEYQKARYK